MPAPRVHKAPPIPVAAQAAQLAAAPRRKNVLRGAGQLAEQVSTQKTIAQRVSSVQPPPQLASSLSLVAQNIAASTAANRSANEKADKRAGPAIAGASNAVDIAATQIGAPYVWADINPVGPRGGRGAGFDCSGLTSWVYGRLGVTLPHSAYGQQQMTAPVRKGQLRPGDLLFFWYPNDRGLAEGQASHVAIYAGNGLMIGAGGGGVEKEPVDWSAFIRGGRVR